MKYAALILIVAVFSISCKKDKTGSPRRALIKEFVVNTPNVGVQEREFTYAGEKVEGEIFAGYPIHYEYSQDKVIANVMHKNGSFWYRETFELGNGGYAIKQLSSSNPVIYYYQFSPDGFIKSEFYTQGNTTHEERYHYDQAGLVDSVFNYNNGSLQSITIYTSFDLDKNYTGENENFGKPFLGKKFIHPPLEFKSINTSGTIINQGAFSYIYDEQGRVTQEVSTTNNVLYNTKTYVYH